MKGSSCVWSPFGCPWQASMTSSPLGAEVGPDLSHWVVHCGPSSLQEFKASCKCVRVCPGFPGILCGPWVFMGQIPRVGTREWSKPLNRCSKSHILFVIARNLQELDPNPIFCAQLPAAVSRVGPLAWAKKNRHSEPPPQPPEERNRLRLESRGLQTPAIEQQLKPLRAQVGDALGRQKKVVKG